MLKYRNLAFGSLVEGQSYNITIFYDGSKSECWKLSYLCLTSPLANNVTAAARINIFTVYLQWNYCSPAAILYMLCQTTCSLSLQQVQTFDKISTFSFIGNINLSLFDVCQKRRVECMHGQPSTKIDDKVNLRKTRRCPYCAFGFHCKIMSFM
jgi:hypothetical protein